MLDALQTCGQPGRRGPMRRHPARLPHRLPPGKRWPGSSTPKARPASPLHPTTQALNTAINGLFGPGDHVITTVCEHNSVLRPLYRLQRQGGEVSFVGWTTNGALLCAVWEKLSPPKHQACGGHRGFQCHRKPHGPGVRIRFCKKARPVVSRGCRPDSGCHAGGCAGTGGRCSLFHRTQGYWARRGPAGCMCARVCRSRPL